MNKLRIGLPSKGRLAEQAEELLRQAGLHFRRQPRSLFALVGELPVEVTFLRTEDIPVLCAEGAIDMGITGSDLVAEAARTSMTAHGIGRRQVPTGHLRSRRQLLQEARANCTAVAWPPAFRA